MVKLPNRDSYGIKRLESKNAKNAIIQKLANIQSSINSLLKSASLTLPQNGNGMKTHYFLNG